MKKWLALLSLSAAVVVAVLAGQFAYENRNTLGMLYAYQFELPKFDSARLDPGTLTGGEFSNITELREASEMVVASVDFKPYLRTAEDEADVRAEKLIEDGFELRGNPVWQAGQPFDWGRDPHKDRNWRFRMNALDHLGLLMTDYHRNSNRRSWESFKYGVWDWVDYNLLQDRKNKFKWYDMAAGIRATRLAFLYYFGLQQDSLSDAELLRLLAVMDMHVEVLSNPRLLNAANHGMFQMLGLASICHVAPLLERCDKGMPFAREKFLEIARNQFTAEAMHVEHSSQYHPWAITNIEEMLGYGYLGELDAPFLAAAKRNTVSYFYPDGKITLLGDTGDQHICSIREIHPFAEFLCTNGESGEQPAEEVSDYRESGYVVIRGPWSIRPLSKQSFLFFNGAFHSQAHKQGDDFSVLWYEKGMPILVDSGKYSYDKNNKWRDYALSTRAHNTVEIDGEDFTMSRRHAYGSALKNVESEDGIHLVLAEVEREKSGVFHRRIVVYQPARFLVVADVMSDGKPHEYRQWFHFHENLSLKRIADSAYSIADQAGEQISTVALHASKQGATGWVRGQEEPEVQGWISRYYRRIDPNAALYNATEAGEVVLTAAFGLKGEHARISNEGGNDHRVRVCYGESGIRLDLDAAAFEKIACRTESANSSGLRPGAS